MLCATGSIPSPCQYGPPPAWAVGVSVIESRKQSSQISCAHNCSHATAALNPFILVYSTHSHFYQPHNHVIEICCALRQLVRAAACCLYARICMIRWQGLDVHNTSRLGRVLEVPWTSLQVDSAVPTLASSPKTSYLSSLRRRARIWLTAAALHFSALGLILLPWHSSILW